MASLPKIFTKRIGNKSIQRKLVLISRLKLVSSLSLPKIDKLFMKNSLDNKSQQKILTLVTEFLPISHTSRTLLKQ